VFTSGGTISVIIQHILNLTDQQTLAINQQARNTSVTKLLFSENMLSVDYFNNYSHLEQAGDDWITFK
jgi:broad specificity phosphatase PhoE